MTETLNSPKKILLVEDEKSLRGPLVNLLTLEKFEVFEAENGEEGLETALAEHPDLILLDVLMPKMNGIEMLQELRKDEWGKTALVILLTNSGSTDNIATALEENVTEYMLKVEWGLEKIVERVKEKLAVTP